MKTIPKPTCYILYSFAAAALLITAQNSKAGSARWLSSPQDSAWENVNNWTPGGPPNGPSDTATFGPSSQREVDISSSVELNNVVFTSDSDSFRLNISPPPCLGCSGGPGGELIFNGSGIANHSSALQTFLTGYQGQIIFNNTSTAGGATIINGTAIFNDSSSAGNAMLVGRGGSDFYPNGQIFFNGTSNGGTARVAVFLGYPSHNASGFLDIGDHQSGVSIGSIEGDGDVFLGANDLTVGTNNLNTTFSGSISNDGHRGSLAKVGSGVLTLQNNYCIAESVGLSLISGSIINLDFTGPDVIASLVVDGVSQPPGVYGGPRSGAPHIVPEFAGTGTVHVLTSTLVNISTRAFVQTGDNVMIGGFIVEGGPFSKEVVIRALGPELTHYGVPNALRNPTLELHDATGALIASNDNWMTTIIGGIIGDDQVDRIRSSGHAPTDPRESAVIAFLPPGNYTAIVRGVNNTVGVALVEVYDLLGDKGSLLGNISTGVLCRRTTM